ALETHENALPVRPDGLDDQPPRVLGQPALLIPEEEFPAGREDLRHIIGERPDEHLTPRAVGLADLAHDEVLGLARTRTTGVERPAIRWPRRRGITRHRVGRPHRALRLLGLFSLGPGPSLG